MASIGTNRAFPGYLGVPRASRGGSAAEMPLARYFFFVGGVLLALLFIVDEVVPKLPVSERANAATDKSVIRIHSDRKWPERVVFDTSLPTIVPASAAKAEARGRSTTAESSPKARVGEAFAQFVPSEPKKPESKPQRKRKNAKSRVAPSMVVAQQRRFGFFENSMW
jgi:hypothetical protein